MLHSLSKLGILWGTRLKREDNLFMKQLVKKAGVLFLLVCTLGGLTACGTEDFDAAGYVKAYLDAMYNQDYEAYAEFTDQTAEKAEAGIVKSEEEDLKASYADMDLTDAELEEYYQAINEVYNNVKYEVKGAEETEDKNYKVTIEVEPVDTLTTFNNSYEEKLIEEYTDATEYPGDSEILKFTIDYLYECSQNMAYGEPVTIEVEVTHDEDNVYSISEDDLQVIETTLMPES